MLDVTRLAAHPQKAMFQPSAFEVILEFALHIAWQLLAPLRQMGGEGRVVLLNNLVEKGLLWPVALVTASRPISLGIPCRGGRRHDSHPCDTVFSYSLALGCGDLKNRL